MGSLGLNEEHYRLVCEVCDRVLLAPESSIERVAIPWLHVIRAHPVFLGSYVDLFESTNIAKKISRQCSRTIRFGARCIRQLGRALRSRGKYWFGTNELASDIDVLIVSHFINPSHAGDETDFYFGDLPNELATQGYSLLIALINHTGQYAAPLSCKWGNVAVPRVFFSDSLSISEELALYGRLKTESSRLKALANLTTERLYRRTLFKASREALSGSSLGTLRMEKQITSLVAKFKPKAIVVTHEGHAWERIAFAAARKAYPQVRCIGYQHAAPFRFQHAIRRSLKPEFNPDQILTCGLTGKLHLEGASRLNGIPIGILGSNRAAKCATPNSASKVNHERKEPAYKCVCLVLPEGMPSERHVLFEFSLVCANLCPEVQFILRMHPYESLSAKVQKLRSFPKNVHLSKAAFEEDLSRSDVTMYRGSTSVIQATMAGLRPIYLHLPGELSIDPLYDLTGWRESVTNASEFISVVNQIIGGGPSTLKSEERAARKYCEDLFWELDPKVLREVVISV